MKAAFLHLGWDALLYGIILRGIWLHAHWTVAIFLTATAIRFALTDLLKRMKAVEEDERVKLLDTYIEHMKVKRG